MMKIRQKQFYMNFLDACEAAVTVVLAVALVLSLVWSIEAAMAADVNTTWDHDGSGPPQTFNLERRLASVPASAWEALGSTPGGGGGSYNYLDADVPSGIFRYRVNAQNSAGASNWLESKLVMPVMTGNLSPLATATASASYPQGPSDYLPANAIDGVFGDLDVDSPTVSWMPDQSPVGHWLQLDWASPVTVDQVLISGSAVLGRMITDCTLNFSDTSSVPCGNPISDNGNPLVLSFSPKSNITWVRMTINMATDYAGVDEIIVVGQQFVVPSPPTNVQVTVQ